MILIKLCEYTKNDSHEIYLITLLGLNNVEERFGDRKLYSIK